MTQLKSKAHPEWPYSGTAHEWRGFVKSDSSQEIRTLSGAGPNRITGAYRYVVGPGEWQEVPSAVYQKQNFGPDLD